MLDEPRDENRNGEHRHGAEHRRQRQGDAAEREAEIGRAQPAEHVLRLHAPRLENGRNRNDQHREARDALHDDDDLGEHVAPQADHREDPSANRRLGFQQRVGSVLSDDIGEIQGAAEDGEVNRLIDEKRGEGDVAGQRRRHNEEGERPAEGSGRRPGIALRRSHCASRRRSEPAQRVRHRERREGRAHRPRRDRNVERSGGVGRRLH